MPFQDDRPRHMPEKAYRVSLDEERHIFERWFRQFNDCLLEALRELSDRQNDWNEKLVEAFASQSSLIQRKPNFKEPFVEMPSQLLLDPTHSTMPNGIDNSIKFSDSTPCGMTKSRTSSSSKLRPFVQNHETDADHRRQFHKDILTKVQERRHLGKQTKARLESISHFSTWIKPPKRFADVVHSQAFDQASGVMTMIFAIVVGMEADMDLRAAWKSQEAPDWVHSAAFVCNASFAFECFLRVLAGGLMYFFGHDWLWNWFDFILVVFSVLDMVGVGSALGFLRIARTAKVVKAFRVIRVLKLVAELRVLLVSLVKSLAALVWSFIFLIMITYLASICFTQGAAVYLREKTTDPLVIQEVWSYYADVPATMYTLIACVTGGDDWRPAADAIWKVGWTYGSVYLVFVLVTVLGLMNVITGIFVEHASNIVEIDREVANVQYLKKLEIDVENSMFLFNEIDTAREGRVTIKHLKNFCRQPLVIAHFANFNMPLTEPEDFALLFDLDADGMITEEEFILGCLSFRGYTMKAEEKLKELNGEKHLYHMEESIQKTYGTLRDLRSCMSSSLVASSSKSSLPNTKLGSPVCNNAPKNTIFHV